MSAFMVHSRSSFPTEQAEKKPKRRTSWTKGLKVLENNLLSRTIFFGGVLYA